MSSIQIPIKPNNELSKRYMIQNLIDNLNKPDNSISQLYEKQILENKNTAKQPRPLY